MSKIANVKLQPDLLKRLDHFVSTNSTHLITPPESLEDKVIFSLKELLP